MATIERVCGAKNCKNPGKHLCSGCSEVSYCSKECQKAHWKIHRALCNKGGSKMEKRGLGKNKNTGAAMGTPSPDQLRQQAAMIRKNPAMVRRANAMFKNYTDDQIKAYADQMEQAANQPEMMKEVERMSRMTNDERDQLQAIQEGLTGTREMNAEWMDNAIAMLKKNPDFYKSLVKGKGAMMGGVTDEQIESFIDAAASMDARTLRWILTALQYLGSWAKPLSELYATLDKATYGTARYILLGLTAIVFYYSAMFWLGIGRWVLYKLLLLFGVVTEPAVTAATAAAGTAAAGGATSASAGVVSSTVADLASAAAVGVGAAAGSAAAAAGAAGNAAKVAGATTAASAAGKKGGDMDAEFEF